MITLAEGLAAALICSPVDDRMLAYMISGSIDSNDSHNLWGSLIGKLE